MGVRAHRDRLIGSIKVKSGVRVQRLGMVWARVDISHPPNQPPCSTTNNSLGQGKQG